MTHFTCLQVRVEVCVSKYFVSRVDLGALGNCSSRVNTFGVASSESYLG